MSSMDELYNQYKNQQMAKANQQYEEIKKKTDAATKKYTDTVNAAYGAATDAAKQYTENQIAAIPQQHQKAYEAADIDRLAGEYQVAETMANMGLTDSGLSRSQMTALNVAQQNANSAIRQQETRAKQNLRDQLASYLAEIEQEKAQTAAQAAYDAETRNVSTLQDLYNNAMNVASGLAQSQYASDVESAKLAAEERQKAEQRRNDINGYIYDAVNIWNETTGSEDEKDEAANEELDRLEAIGLITREEKLWMAKSIVDLTKNK